jgi:hypothetical protein
VIVSNAGSTAGKSVPTVPSLNSQLSAAMPLTRTIDQGIGHFFKLQSVTLNSATLSLKAGNAVTLTANGMLFIWSLFLKQTVAITVTTDMTVGPSHDPSDRSRILAFTPGTIAITGPSWLNLIADTLAFAVAARPAQSRARRVSRS